MKIGIDLGGSHIGIGIIGEQGTILEKQEVDLLKEERNNLQEFIQNYLEKSVQKILKQYVIEGIGVASPGTPSQGKITTLVNLGIREFDITSFFRKMTDVPIQIRNDAKCAGLAEKKYGALKPYEDAVFLCLGTGIGGSAFLQGKELIPKRNPGLEIGHMIIKKDGNLCKCGKKGCFETYCSMKSLKNKLIQILEVNKSITSKELLEKLIFNQNEEKVQKFLQEYTENLIIGLSNVIDIFEPQAICLGGSFVYFEEVLYELLVEKYYTKRYVFNKGSLPELKLAKLGNDAGMIGSTIFI
jgi:glucokinase